MDDEIDQKSPSEPAALLAQVESCRAKEVVRGKLVECLVMGSVCEHSFHFGNKLFCSHPLKHVIAKRTQKQPERQF